MESDVDHDDLDLEVDDALEVTTIITLSVSGTFAYRYLVGKLFQEVDGDSNCRGRVLVQLTVICERVLIGFC